jgi:thioredoxin-dependent peroxiredoxin
MLGKPVPDFSLPSTGATPPELSALRGTKQQGSDFREVYGVSRDAMKFPFELLSGSEEHVCTQFGVMKQKNMYAKKVRDIERSTFVIDEEGMLAREWRGVKVPGHVEEVVSFAKAL